MAGRIVYLEIDDEITSAAARIRASDASRIAVVLPYGSRVATSRINFRLLSRDALTHEKRLSVVAADPATRALAASAGLPVFSSVAEYESSETGAEDEPRPADARVAAAAVAIGSAPVADEPPTPAPVAAEPPTPVEPPASDGTLGLIVPAAAVGTAAAAGVATGTGDTMRTPLPRPEPMADRGSAEPVVRPAGISTGITARSTGRGGIRTPWLIGGAILALAVLVAGVGAYLVLPSATIVVTPDRSVWARST